MGDEIKFAELIAALKAEHEERERESQHLITLPRAVRDAFRPSRLNDMDRKHMADCPTCRRRIERARETGHPSREDIAAYLRGTLTEEDQASVSGHLAALCAEPLCLVARLRRWSRWAEEIVLSPLAVPLAVILPRPEIGMSYAPPRAAVSGYHHLTRVSDFDVLIEEQAGDVLLVAVRLATPGRKFAKLYLALNTGARIVEHEAPWNPASRWPVRVHIRGAHDLLSAGEPLEITILPVLQEAE